MSQRACSIPLIADMMTGPPRQNECRYMICQRCWIRRGSCTLDQARELADGGHHRLRLALERRLAEALTTPSSVRTWTRTQLRMPPSTTSVSIGS